MDRDEVACSDSVVYESGYSLIAVEFNPNHVLGVYLGDLPQQARGQTLSQHRQRLRSALDRLVRFDAVKVAPKTTERVHQVIGLVAERFLGFCGDLIGSGPIDLAAVSGASEALQDHRLSEWRQRQRQEAAAAFDRQDWRTAWRLYRVIWKELTPAELQQLEVARDRMAPLVERRGEDDRAWLMRRAEYLERSSRMLHEIWRHREESSEARKWWSEAADEFHDARYIMYPHEFYQHLDRINVGDPAAIDEAITFLEVDPWCFHSGYVKRTILRRLRHVSLGEAERQRLSAVILRTLESRFRPEFRNYAKLAAQLADPKLRKGIADRLAWKDAKVRLRACWMLDVLPGEASDDERSLIRSILLETALDENWSWVGGLVRRLARKYEDDDWKASLLTQFRAGDSQASDSALRILCLLRRPGFGPEDAAQLTARILRAVESDDLADFERVARIAGRLSQELIERLKKLEDDQDERVAQRARLALRAKGQ
ncbi:MAG: hypothetical protein M3077_12745 [Candidatus Dormibacteraeota bacterium]|nr:hypothetical protein [Candidatus Dormibacteraeota bacterium]